MVTFLRKIRRSLVDSGSSGRYLLYAIGEIALVVIRILIALQMNNWNEWRKDRNTELIILKKFKKPQRISVIGLISYVLFVATAMALNISGKAVTILESLR